MIDLREACGHIMFSLTRRDPPGISSAYFLTVEQMEDLPPDAEGARVLHTGDLVYTATDGRSRTVHAHNTGGEVRVSQFGYPWVETRDEPNHPISAWIYRLQHPPIPD
ncbi:hypothetical protein HY469_02690 [Candidatus Roizmanbacteria bacterium]|nr:hypothetical protein [Candidatus Roizmanbacteria bacterium]